MWNGDQCNYIKGVEKPATVAEIQEACEQTPQCTAINVDTTGGGVLRACPIPVPSPLWNISPWEGYYQGIHQ